MSDMTSNRSGSIWFWLILILMAAVLAAGGVFLASAPGIRRERMLSQLADLSAVNHRDTLADALSGLRSDPAIQQAVIAALETEDQTIFLDVVATLDSAGLWLPDRVPCDAWLRWVKVIAANDPGDEEARIASRVLAAERLAQATHCASPAAAAFLGDLAAAADHPDVRYNALITAAILAPHFSPSDGVAPPASRSRPSDNPFASVILHLAADEEVIIAEQAWILAGLLRIAPTAGEETAVSGDDLSAGDAAAREAYLRRTTYARQWAQTRSATAATAATKLPVPVLEIERLDGDARLDAIELLLRSDVAPQRDVGCVLAAKHLDQEQLVAIITQLLNDEDIDSIRSGVMLWAITDPKTRTADSMATQITEVSEKHTLAVEPLVHLAHWIRGDKPEVDDIADLLFTRDELPMSTTALALLQQDRLAIVLDHLLNPTGQPPVDLFDLLIDHQWWRVLAPHLPDDARWIDMDAGYEAQRFGIDVLRNWYLLDRTSAQPQVVHAHTIATDPSAPSASSASLAP